MSFLFSGLQGFQGASPLSEYKIRAPGGSVLMTIRAQPDRQRPAAKAASAARRALTQDRNAASPERCFATFAEGLSWENRLNGRALRWANPLRLASKSWVQQSKLARGQIPGGVCLRVCRRTAITDHSDTTHVLRQIPKLNPWRAGKAFPRFCDRLPGAAGKAPEQSGQRPPGCPPPEIRCNRAESTG